MLEGTELYDALQSAVTEYAKGKKEYDSRLKELAELYEGKNANVEQELVADLVGDYLFTDADFIKHLSTEHRNLAQKIYDEIKYLCKIVTAGTKEARQLEKVKKAFADAYRAETKNPTKDGGVRYSIVNLDTGKSYVQSSRQVIHGNSVAEWRSQISEFFNRALKNGPIEIETIEGDMLTISKNTAEKARSKTATENGVSRELTDKEFLVKLHAEAHIDELAEISHKNKRPPVPDGKNHSFAKDGFTYRTVYFQDFDGSYYRITLSVGENNGISTVYNVGKIKADDIPDGKIISTIGSKADMSSTKLSISGTSENVNNKNSSSNIAPPVGADVHGKDIAAHPDDWIPIRKDIPQKAESSVPPENTNAVSKPLSSYSAEKQKSIKAYLNAVDESIKKFAQRVKSGDLTFKRQKISDVSQRAADDIGNLIGADVNGYTHNINTNGMQHIIIRHGENGKQDKSMSLDDDIARIGWVLENYDNVELVTEDGKPIFSSEFLDKNHNPAQQIRFTKKIDGTYYVVEAAFENDYKKLWVQSAYLQKNEDVTQTPAEGTSTDHETNAQSAFASPSSNHSIPNSTPVVNPEDSTGAAPSGFDPVSHLQYEYGSLSEGEKPVREDSLPKSTTGKDKVSLTAGNGDQMTRQTIKTAL